jgi:hypothetical protein
MKKLYLMVVLVIGLFVAFSVGAAEKEYVTPPLPTPAAMGTASMPKDQAWYPAYVMASIAQMNAQNQDILNLTLDEDGKLKSISMRQPYQPIKVETYRKQVNPALAAVLGTLNATVRAAAPVVGTVLGIREAGNALNGLVRGGQGHYYNGSFNKAGGDMNTAVDGSSVSQNRDSFNIVKKIEPEEDEEEDEEEEDDDGGGDEDEPDGDDYQSGDPMPAYGGSN